MMDLLKIFISADLAAAMPILLAALGLVMSERTGVLNIGGEGIMLIGALFGIIGTYYFGNVWLGLLTGAVVGVLFAAIFAYFTVILRANQVVVGMGMNMFGLGFTTTLNRTLFAGKGYLVLDKLEKIILIKDPTTGFGRMMAALLNQDLIVYAAFILVFVLQFVMFKTDIGLKIRAIGEYPKATATLGVDVIKVRFRAVLFSGLLLGLAGAYVSAGQVSGFAENMIQGRGFMAIAVVVLSRYTPLGSMFAALAFAAGTAISYIMIAKGIDLPNHVFQMIPYAVTVLALIVSVGDYKGPKSSTIPYVPQN